MQISHELPLEVLNHSNTWNDYEYCLPHMLDKYPKYLQHFLDAREKGRFIIMDNGLYEGINHTEKDLIQKINLINPNIFIVPDTWNDAETTFWDAHIWNQTKDKLPTETELMVVMQGRNFEDICRLFLKCEEIGYTHFAFNHSSIYYQKKFHHKNALVNAMFGRIDLITDFYKRNMLKDKYVHLLGCSLKEEFGYYNGYPINSLDTSNPVTMAYEGASYKDIIDWKSVIKIDDIMEKIPPDYFLLKENIELFKLNYGIQVKITDREGNQ